MAMQLLDQMKSAKIANFTKWLAKWQCFLTKRSAPQSLSESPLCEVCSALDLVEKFRQGMRERDSISLGVLATILSKKHACGFCGLISHLISRDWRLDLHPDEDLTSVQVKLCVVDYAFADSKNVAPRIARAHRIRISARRPMAIHRTVMKEKANLTLDLQMMEDDAARFGRERAYHGRRVGMVVNFKLIKEWMRICEKKHGPSCANMWKNVTEQLPQGARMIDVVQMALVEPSQNCRYVALSYVWGTIDTEYITVSKNVAQRCQKGSLKSVALPRTIHDAIKVVQKLGERYLWVDAMCIIQDDPDNVKAQIAGMAVIYGAAVLTIFAVGGNSADAPVAGLEPGSRQDLQRIERIQSLSLAVPLRMLEETLASSKWNTRGWTFQERLLSRRGLFFTTEQLFFKCQSDVFSEDVIVESSKDTAMYQGKFSGPGFKLHFNRGNHLRLRYENYASTFMEMVEEYTRRELTNSTDIYNAIFAIITVFSRDIEIAPLDPDTAFLFGMPVSVLENAMLWQPALNAPAHNRRCEKGLVTPSWSWVGWKSGVAYDNDREGFMHGSPGAGWSLVDEWVIVDPGGRARRIAVGRQLLEIHGPGPVQTVKYCKPVSPPGASLVEEGASLAPGTLLFYTTVALLRVRKVNNEGNEITAKDRRSEVLVYGSQFHSVFEIFSETSLAKMGRIVLPTDIDTMVPFEFVVLSRSSSGAGPETYDERVFGERYEGSLLNVMVVKQIGQTVDGKDVSERVGVGVIAEAAWCKARFKERVIRLQ